jgi:hypothetical protein
MFDKIIEFLTGGFATKLIDTVRGFFPPSMSEAEKKEFELKLMEITNQHDLELLREVNAAEAEFNTRIKDMEGTASDLSKLPYLGSVILFLRGCQRPAFGILVLVMDYQVFSGGWNLSDGSRIESAFFAINILVLGFLFGERAVKNIMPLVQKMSEK